MSDKATESRAQKLLYELFERFSRTVLADGARTGWATRLFAEHQSLSLADLSFVLKRLGMERRLFFELLFAGEPRAQAADLADMLAPQAGSSRFAEAPVLQHRLVALRPDEEDVAFSDRARDLLARLVAKQGRGRVAQAMGINRMRLWRLFGERKQFPLQGVVAVLRALDAPVSAFFDLLTTGETPMSPAALLNAFGRKRQKLNVPFLSELDRHLSRLRNSLAGITEMCPGSRFGQIEDLEDERHRRRSWVQGQAETLCLDIASSDSPTSADLTELALALGLWSTIQRTLGQHRASSEALYRAFGLIDGKEATLVESLLCQRGVFLLLDLDRPVVAGRLADKAGRGFEVLGDHRRSSWVWIARGAICYHQFDAKGVILCNREALERIPQEEWRWRLAAHQNLAAALEMLGDLEEAARQIDLALSCCQTEDAALGVTYWRRGSLAMSADDWRGATSHLLRSRELLNRFGEPIDLGLASLDLAICLVTTANIPALRYLAQESLRILERFKEHPVLDSIMGEFVLIVLKEKVSLGAIHELRSRCHREIKIGSPSNDPKRPRSNIHPPTGICPPNSGLGSPTEV